MLRHRAAAPAALLALAATLLLSAAVPAASAAAAAAAPQVTLLPQLRPEWPWEVSREKVPKLPWEALQNDLPGLLKVQARDKQVAIIVFNEGFSALALNCLVSLVAYGNSPNYIITSVGASSLSLCQALRLPCFDGANLLSNITSLPEAAAEGSWGEAGAAAANKSALSTEADAKRYSADWFHLVWIKTLIAHAVNNLGYDILFAGEVSGGVGEKGRGGRGTGESG